MRRALSLIPLVLMSACGRPAGDPDPALRTIDCAVGGATALAPVCGVEQAGDQLIVHQPGGGFRRLHKVADGRGVVTADGAEAARVAWAGPGRLQVVIGAERYVFPATMKPDAR